MMDKDRIEIKTLLQQMLISLLRKQKTKKPMSDYLL